MVFPLVSPMVAISWTKAANISKNAEKLSWSKWRRIKKWQSAPSSLEQRVDSALGKLTNLISATMLKPQAINGRSYINKLSESKLGGKTGLKTRSNMRRIFMRWNSRLKFTKSIIEAPTSPLLSHRWSRRWPELWSSDCKKSSTSWTQIRSAH